MSRLLVIGAIHKTALDIETLEEIRKTCSVSTEIRISPDRYRQMSATEGVGFLQLRQMLINRGLNVISDDSVPYQEVFIIAENVPQAMGGPTVHRKGRSLKEVMTDQELTVDYWD